MLREAVHSEVARLDQQERRVATGGIRLEALGLFLMLVGLVLQAVAGMFG